MKVYTYLGLVNNKVQAETVPLRQSSIVYCCALIKFGVHKFTSLIYFHNMPFKCVSKKHCYSETVTSKCLFLHYLMIGQMNKPETLIMTR